MKSRLLNLWRYATELLFLVSWVIMMIYPEKVGAFPFRLFLCGCVICGVSYSLCRQACGSAVQTGKVEKILTLVMIVALAVRLLLA